MARSLQRQGEDFMPSQQMVPPRYMDTSRSITTRPKLFGIEQVNLGQGENMFVVTENKDVKQMMSKPGERGVVGVVKDVTLQAIRYLFVKVLLAAQKDTTQLTPQQALQIASLAEQTLTDIEKSLNTSAMKNNPEGTLQSMEFNNMTDQLKTLTAKLADLKRKKIELENVDKQLHHQMESEVQTKLAEITTEIMSLEAYLAEHRGKMNTWRADYEKTNFNSPEYIANGINSYVNDATSLIPRFLEVIASAGKQMTMEAKQKIVADFRKLLEQEVVNELTPF